MSQHADVPAGAADAADAAGRRAAGARSTPAERHVAAGPHPAPVGIDPRGPRVGAGLTAVLLIVVLLLSGAAATIALAVVALLFAVGAVRGAQGSLQGLAFRALVRPRLTPPTTLEDPRPPRFAQTVGLVITGAGVLLALAGVPAAVPVAAALASSRPP